MVYTGRVNRPKTGFLLWIGMLLIVLGLLLLVFEFAAYDATFHINVHTSLESATRAGITQEQMAEMSEALIDYLRGMRDDLPVIATEEGTPLIGETMAMHMEDVRVLFSLLSQARVVLLCAGVLLATAGAIGSRGRRSEKIKNAGMFAVAAWTIFVIVIVAYGWYDFNTLFTRFHELFFTNELWLLDPATDPIILLLSEDFFLSVAARAALYMAGAMVSFSLLVHVPEWIVNRRMYGQS